MKSLGGLLAIFASVSLLGVGSVATADTANEFFRCTFNDGKTMDDLMKVVDEWKPIVAKFKGGDSYTARILEPIASDTLDSIVWAGQSPNFELLGGMDDQHQGTPEGQAIVEKFNEVLTCEARSFWRNTQVHGMTKGTEPILDIFFCEYHDGKGMDDLMKVIEVWKPVVAKMKNGDAYSVQISTPIASQNMNSVVWVGAAPSLATLGGLLDEYDASPETTKLDEMFEEVMECDSRRMSRATKVK